MEKSTYNPILFLGNRASNFADNLDIEMEKNTLTFSPANPGSNEHNYLIFNNKKLRTEAEYTLDELKTSFVDLLSEKLIPNSFQFIIGDPSEILYQAFTLALIETQLFSFQNLNEIHIWLYPIGMVSLDIRKEVSFIIHQLKKSEIPVLLIDKTAQKPSELIEEIIIYHKTFSISELETKHPQLKQILGKQNVNLING